MGLGEKQVSQELTTSKPEHLFMTAKPVQSNGGVGKTKASRCQQIIKENQPNEEGGSKILNPQPRQGSGAHGHALLSSEESLLKRSLWWLRKEKETTTTFDWETFCPLKATSLGIRLRNTKQLGDFDSLSKLSALIFPASCLYSSFVQNYLALGVTLFFFLKGEKDCTKRPEPCRLLNLRSRHSQASSASGWHLIFTLNEQSCVRKVLAVLGGLCLLRGVQNFSTFI